MLRDKMKCHLLYDYRFDWQRCPITLESDIFTVVQLNITVRPDRPGISFSMYTDNGLWEVVQMQDSHTQIYHASRQTAFSRVIFKMHLIRRSTYYVVNILFPSLLLSLLQLLNFCMPLENEERVPQGTEVLLTIFVFHSISRNQQF